MNNNKKITIGLIITLFLVITGVTYYNGSISNTKDDKTVASEFLEKSHQVTKKDITEFDVGSPIETSIERYEKMLREKYEIYFSEEGMILAIANRDTDWLVQAAVNNGFKQLLKM